MPRSYSFDHFQNAPNDADQHDPKRDKARVTQQKNGSFGGLHYGKAHAQTEELIAVRQMNRQLEELASQAEAEEKMSRPYTEKGEGLDDLLSDGRVLQRAPIGAIPVTEEPLPPGMFRDLLDDARRYVKLLGSAFTDARTASMHLLKLPVDAAKLLANRMQMLRA
jgi:hypothetical protein